MTKTKSRLGLTLGLIAALGASTAACAYDPYGRHHDGRWDRRGDHHRGDHRDGHDGHRDGHRHP